MAQRPKQLLDPMRACPACFASPFGVSRVKLRGVCQRDAIGLKHYVCLQHCQDGLAVRSSLDWMQQLPGIDLTTDGYYRCPALTTVARSHIALRLPDHAV
jgi:hypothetical protein